MVRRKFATALTCCRIMGRPFANFAGIGNGRATGLFKTSSSDMENTITANACDCTGNPWISWLSNSRSSGQHVDALHPQCAASHQRHPSDLAQRVGHDLIFNEHGSPGVQRLTKGSANPVSVQLSGFNSLNGAAAVKSDRDYRARPYIRKLPTRQTLRSALRLIAANGESRSQRTCGSP